MNTSQLLLVSSLGLGVNLFGMFAMGGHHHVSEALVLLVEHADHLSRAVILIPMVMTMVIAMDRQHLRRPFPLAMIMLTIMTMTLAIPMTTSMNTAIVVIILTLIPSPAMTTPILHLHLKVYRVIHTLIPHRIDPPSRIRTPIFHWNTTILIPIP